MAATSVQTSSGGPPVLSVRGLTKRFGGVAALRDANFSVERGEIHALLGANGAGKSTLIKILAGVYRADHGDIQVGGQPMLEAGARRQISFVHQDLGLIESMSVGENMAMVYGYARRWKLIDWRAVNAAAAKALDILGSPLPLDRPVSDLSRAEKSIMAIARALIGDVETLILDEPTASLPEADVGRLFDILERLRDRGVSIVYVSHRLNEVFRIADAVTVLRDGRDVAVYRPASVSPEQLVVDIVGHAPTVRAAIPRGDGGTAALEVDNLRVGDVGPVTFRAARGEILGLAGLRGQGHEAIGRAIAGVVPSNEGSVRLSGIAATVGSPAAAIAAGIGFVSSKRAEEALAMTLKVGENLFLNPQLFGRRDLELRGRRSESAAAGGILGTFDVRPRDPGRDIATLSGGNQQKVVLARWAGRRYKLLVLEEPTIGVDVGAKAEIYRILAEDAAAGTTCLVISSDLDELVQICDRVLTFNRGRITADLGRDRLTVEALTREVSGTGTDWDGPESRA